MCVCVYKYIGERRQDEEEEAVSNRLLIIGRAGWTDAMTWRPCHSPQENKKNLSTRSCLFVSFECGACNLFFYFWFCRLWFQLGMVGLCCWCVVSCRNKWIWCRIIWTAWCCCRCCCLVSPSTWLAFIYIIIILFSLSLFLSCVCLFVPHKFVECWANVLLLFGKAPGLRAFLLLAPVNIKGDGRTDGRPWTRVSSLVTSSLSLFFYSDPKRFFSVLSCSPSSRTPPDSFRW